MLWHFFYYVCVSRLLALYYYIHIFLVLFKIILLPENKKMPINLSNKTLWNETKKKKKTKLFFRSPGVSTQERSLSLITWYVCQYQKRLHLSLGPRIGTCDQPIRVRNVVKSAHFKNEVHMRLLYFWDTSSYGDADQFAGHHLSLCCRAWERGKVSSSFLFACFFFLEF